MMSHQTITYSGKVIYEANVDLNDPALKQVALEINIDGASWGCHSAVGQVAVQSMSGTPGYMVSCVVRDLKADGTASVDIVYTLRNPSQGVNKSGHISATVKAEQRYENTTQSGTRVALLLHTDRT